MFNRRQWLRGLGLVLGAAQTHTAHAVTSAESSDPAKGSSGERLALEDYEPKSMLHVHETRVERARFPAVDIHTHITVAAKSEKGVELSAERAYLGKPDELLSTMDRKNVRAMVNLTGGYGNGCGSCQQVRPSASRTLLQLY